MRINSINVVSPRNYATKQRLKEHNPETNSQNAENVNFQGKFGAWVGGIGGTGALIAAVATCAVAPAALCLLGGAAIVGAVGGSALEDTVNEENDNKSD